LLLRSSVAIAILIQGGFYLGGRADSTAASWFVGWAAILTGVALLIGFLTPVVAVVAGLGAVAVGLSLLPPCTPNLFDAKLQIIFAAIMLAAVVFLGPGAFSLDARLFGRREIIIPPVARAPK